MKSSFIISRNILLINLALIQFISSCKKFVQIDAAPNLIESDKVFSNDQTVISAVAGLYTQMRLSTTALSNGGMTLYPGLSADEIYNTSSNSVADPFYTNSLLSNNSTIASSFWSSAYTNIYKVNAIIEGLVNSSSVTDSIKQQVTGEMKVVRAFYYYYLVNLFGDVPLITTTDYQANSVMPRTASAQVYDQIILDLKDAESLLKTSYPSNDRARPNKWTASALLSCVYLYRSDWVHAEFEANAVINSGLYNLTANLNTTFLISSPETIWQIASDISTTSEAASFIPSSVTVLPTYAITGNLINAFEAGDQRKVSWLNKNTIGSQDYYYPYKYKNKNSSTITEYDIVLRLSEQYLIRAEARAKQNNISGAQNDLNIIRTRAGLLNTTATTQSQLLDAIAHERQAELFAEWGHRWLDLKRTGRADAVLGPIKAPNWQSTDALYPIPFAQLQLNVFLTQNPGY